MEHIAELRGIVTGFHVTEYCIDCMCGKNLMKVDKDSRNIIFQKEIFEKEGLSRKLIADKEQIFIYDFCTLYALSQKNYELIGKWQLGSDLSSDICGIAVDGNTIYCSIRNGKIITLDRQSYQIKEFVVSESSMWSIKLYDSYLVCGTVDGKVLLLDQSTLSIEKELVLGKKNIGSLHIDGDTLYAACHDGKLFKINMRSFEIKSFIKNAHKKMFDCAGIYENMLITVSYPCSEIAFWEKDTLEKIRVMNIPLRLSGRTHIENNFMYISSRNILGIDRIPLNEEVPYKEPIQLLPSSYIFQLTELGVCHPVCSLIRSKDGISLYRVESEGKKLILKVFEKQEDAREIDNYLILSKLGIPTLPLLGYTKNAILLPDVASSDEYRLGEESDLSDLKVARAIAKWYRVLHKKGSAYLSGREVSMYDESDLLTEDNMRFIAEKTCTMENGLWKVIAETYSTIRSRIDALPRTLTYNDFYWTNLIVSKTGEYAFMFDYNLLGKGIAYGDIRNVVSSLSREAAEAFLQEYGSNITEEQKKADAFIAPLVTLVDACKYGAFPSWSKASLEELKNGDILRHLKEWLS